MTRLSGSDEILVAPPTPVVSAADFLTQMLILRPYGRVYRRRGPASASSPWKSTIASAGALRPLPYSSTWEARTICNAGSCANAAIAASSALLAPPTRHEDSSTPDRGRPSA